MSTPCTCAKPEFNLAHMIKRDLLKYSKFYVQLEKLEIELRDTVNLGIHLKAANPELFKKLDDAADAVFQYFNEEEKDKN